MGSPSLLFYLAFLYPFFLHCQSSPLPPTSPSLLMLPPNITTVHLNIGANLTPLHPPKNAPTTAVVAIEPNLAIANFLRETFQKARYINQFFVISCAIAGKPLAGSFATFHHYNVDATSSSLSRALTPLGQVQKFASREKFSPTEHYGPGPGGVDFVPVLTLEAVLKSVPERVRIEYLKMDTQGYDLQVIQSASRKSLKRVERIMTETYLPGMAERRYEGVKNDLHGDWIPYMKKMGFKLTNPPDRDGGEYDAIWVQDLN